jgi:hypothetical protein
VCRLRGESMREAAEWLDRYRAFWEESLDRLVDYLEAKPQGQRRKR